MRSGEGARHTERGVAYLLLIMLVAASSAIAAHGLQTGAALGRRAAERELLAIGDDLEAALRSHGGRPRALAELLRDPRVPGVRRHLRRVPADPLTGTADWGLLCDRQGGIVGVFSQASGQPLQREGFQGPRAHFNQAASYRDWVFGTLPDQSLRMCSTSDLNSRL